MKRWMSEAAWRSAAALSHTHTRTHAHTHTHTHIHKTRTHTTHTASCFPPTSLIHHSQFAS